MSSYPTTDASLTSKEIIPVWVEVLWTDVDGWEFRCQFISFHPVMPTSAKQARAPQREEAAPNQNGGIWGTLRMVLFYWVIS